MFDLNCIRRFWSELCPSHAQLHHRLSPGIWLSHRAPFPGREAMPSVHINETTLYAVQAAFWQMHCESRGSCLGPCAIDADQSKKRSAIDERWRRVRGEASLKSPTATILQRDAAQFFCASLFFCCTVVVLQAALRDMISDPFVWYNWCLLVGSWSLFDADHQRLGKTTVRRRSWWCLSMTVNSGRHFPYSKAPKRRRSQLWAFCAVMVKSFNIYPPVMSCWCGMKCRCASFSFRYNSKVCWSLAHAVEYARRVSRR